MLPDDWSVRSSRLVAALAVSVWFMIESEPPFMPLFESMQSDVHHLLDVKLKFLQ